MKKLFFTFLFLTIFVGFGYTQKTNVSELEATEKITKRINRRSHNTVESKEVKSTRLETFLSFLSPLTCTNTGGIFLDSGGTGLYGDNLDELYTICPDDVGDYVVLDFTTVVLENCCDVLSVYDGNTTSTVLDADLESPATFTSTDTSGCLLVTFTSDGSVNAEGWEATVTCVTPPFGYWINGSPAPADGWATCPDVVIKDPTGYAYDSGGPVGNAMNPEHNITTICPDGAATVNVTIDYNMEGGTLDVFDGPSRNNRQDGSTDSEVVLTDSGTYSFTTSGPCFSYYAAQFGGAGYLVNWSINTVGIGFTLPMGDLCENPYIIDGAITNSISNIDATSGPVYNGGVIVAGSGCEPDLIGDGCTATIENTIYAQFTACNSSGTVTISLSNSNCTPGTQTPQFFVYEGTCGALNFIDCESSAVAGTTLINTFTPTLGATYYVIIDGFRGNECTWDLDVMGCIETCTLDAGTDGSTNICNSNGIILNIPSVLGGTPDIGGIWTDADNAGVDLSDPNNVDFSGIPEGTYIFTYTHSCNNESATVTVNITGIPTLDFCLEIAGNTVMISNSSIGSGPLDYNWDFGDGSVSTDENPIHTYAASTEAVTYEVCLAGTFGIGTSTCCKEITIYPPCQDNITGPTFNYLFKNNGYVKFNNPSGVGNAFTKEWTIDGVFHSDLNQPPTKILSPGIHRVCLTVTRNSNPNCSETFCRDILVNDPCVVPSKIEFSYENCLHSNTFLFGAITTGTNNGTIVHWDFGNGDTGTGNTTEYTYPDYGSYMVCMDVVNSGNCSKKVCGIIHVVEPICKDDCLPATAAAKVTSDKIPRKEPLDELNEGTELQIIPNPASNVVKAVFTEMQSDKAAITLRDINGKVITQVSIAKGTRNYEFDISDLPAGVYIMTLEQSNGEKISSKIMKM